MGGVGAEGPGGGIPPWGGARGGAHTGHSGTVSAAPSSVLGPGAPASEALGTSVRARRFKFPMAAGAFGVLISSLKECLSGARARSPT